MSTKRQKVHDIGFAGQYVTGLEHTVGLYHRAACSQTRHLKNGGHALYRVTKDKALVTCERCMMLEGK